ncbi:MAG: hypothetical protein H0T79_22540 [Deltaproteobacteria bacterium]|nr:hypothetical protein [Deltaproteobacteria bacterium]
MVRAGSFVGFVLTVALIAPARAAPPVTDRNYAIELYDGVALGNSATIATGGAAAANAIGSSGTLTNPSAPAVRPTTDTDDWSWDYHLDALTSTLSSDYDNNGVATANTGGASAVTAGLAGRYHDWAIAVTTSYQRATLVDTTVTIGGAEFPLFATTSRTRIALARWVSSIDVAIGASVQVARLDLEPDCDDAGCEPLFGITGTGGELGATWIPRLQNVRIGGAVTSSIQGGKVATSNCDPMDCNGFILPSQVVSPWRLAAGVAYRWSETAWNQLVGGHFRDEPSLTVVADVVVTGASANAFGLEAFGQHELQRSGRHLVLSPRGGAEYEWLPGRLRVRAGSYWEPQRFVDTRGRLHATFGLELRVLQFQAWGPRRGRITLTGDVAARYSNVGLSVGFWH